MISQTFFPSLLEYYQKYSSQRHLIIKESSDILRNAKQAIFSLHRGDNQMAEDLLATAKTKIEFLYKQGETGNIKISPQTEGSFLAAIEEYLEAVFYYNFLQNKTITFEEGLETALYEQYLGAICDYTGELVRKAVQDVIKGDFSNLDNIHQEAESVYGGLIKFNLTGKLRSKYDDAKRNIKRLEEIMYEVKIRNIKI